MSHPIHLRRLLATLLVALLALGLSALTSGSWGPLSPQPAKAATNQPNHKVGVCHATNSDSNPYRFIVVDMNSTKYKGHLQHRETPNKTWKYNNKPKPDLIDGLDGPINSLADCPKLEAPPSTPPSCVEQSAAVITHAFATNDETCEEPSEPCEETSESCETPPCSESCGTNSPTPTPTRTRTTTVVTPEESPMATASVLAEKATATPSPVVAGGKLPYTGSPVAATAALSAALLAGGALLLAASKRRRAGTHR